MDIEEVFKEDLNTRRKKVNTFEHIYKRLLKHRGVLGVTILTNHKLLRSSLPQDKAEAAVETWTAVTKRLGRDLKEFDFDDELLTLQVSTVKHECVIAFGKVDEDPEKSFAIMVHQVCQESAVPNQYKKVVDSKLSSVKELPKDPREQAHALKSILQFRRKMWKDPAEFPFEEDPQFNEKSRSTELEFLEELQKAPANRGHRRYGRELEIFYYFLSRCKLGPPDPKTGKCKWSWLDKPAIKSFGIPNIYTMEMAKEFTETHEEVEKAADDINELIEEEGVLEPNKVEDVKRGLDKQKKKILMKKLEDLRRQRQNKKWKKKVLKRWSQRHT